MDLSEKQTPNIFIQPKIKNDTIVIDNGTFEIKAGYQGDLCIIAKNKIYKNKDRVSLEPFPSASVKSMFDEDVITNFDSLEYTIDQVLDFLAPSALKNLIFTSTPASPTEHDLIEFLFEVYKFEKIQIGTDSIYSYHKYFDKQDCVVVDFKYSSILVTVIQNGEIKDTLKVGFGGKELLEYINYYMIDRYKEARKDYKGLTDYIRVSDDYSKESVEIYNEMCSGNYQRNLFLSQDSNVIVKAEPTAKKAKKNVQNPLTIPIIDYMLLNTPDESLNSEQIKEKRRFKLIFSSTLARFKAKIQSLFTQLDNCIAEQEEELEKLTNLKNYIAKKKAKFQGLKRELELREQIRKNSKLRKTREFQVRNKEGVLTEEEQAMKNRILDAEDEEQENALISDIDRIALEIVSLDPEFIPYYANTVEILRGDNIGRQCVNVELIKFPEIFFDPSIVGSEQMGLKEIFENVFSTYQIENVLLCGGFSFMKNLENRIRTEVQQLLFSGNVNLIRSSDPQKDPFHGACFSKFYPVYTRNNYKKLCTHQANDQQKP